MKQQDIALIIISAGISGIISLVIGSVVLGGTNRSTAVETVAPIEASFIEPSSDYFNSDALNPTKDIQIGDEVNPTPFDSPVEQVTQAQGTQPAN